MTGSLTGTMLVLGGALLAAPASTPVTGGTAPPIHWFHDETIARARSRETGKPLLIDFRADWCAACTMLDRLTWSDPAVRAEVAASYIALELDLSAEDDAAADVMKRYAVSSLPTVLAHRQRVTGFVPAREMLTILKRASLGH